MLFRRKHPKAFSVLQYVVVILAISLVVLALHRLAKQALQEKFRQSVDSFSGGKKTKGGKLYIPSQNEASGNDDFGNWDFED